MPTINGKVESVRKDGMGFKVDGQWYGSATKLDSKLWKAEVEFETDGKNIIGDVKTTAAAAPAGGFKKGGFSGGGFKKDPETDARICRQNALTNAVNLAAIYGPDKATVGAVLKVAREFANWTINGDN